jgi:ADP-ribosylglycohydrolase
MFEIEDVDLSLLTEREKSKYHFYMRMQSEGFGTFTGDETDLTKEDSDAIIKGLLNYRKKKVENAIWGFVIGDCLGVPYEFRKKETFKYKERQGFGTHNQPPMTWSDDTALMLALIDSFENGKFNIETHKENLRNFLKGHYSVDGVLFDVGAGTRKAIQQDFNVDISNSLGNGGLLRCWLVGTSDKEQLSNFIALTHSNGELYMQCCNLYIALLNDVLELGKEGGLKKWRLENEAKFDTLIKDNERLSRTEGCIVETLRIVISSYLKGETIKYVIELGGDTDSNAALFGALKGAEKDKAVLKYKKHIRCFEQIERYL